MILFLVAAKDMHIQVISLYFRIILKYYWRNQNKVSFLIWNSMYITSNQEIPTIQQIMINMHIYCVLRVSLFISDINIWKLDSHPLEYIISSDTRKYHAFKINSKCKSLSIYLYDVQYPNTICIRIVCCD